MSQCPCCKAEKWSEAKNVKDHSISKESFLIEECLQCGFVKTSNAPSSENIGPYYASEDYISHSDSKKSLREKLYHSVRQYMLSRKYRWIDQLKTESRNILDIGCVTGYFPAYMKSKKWSVLGLEPDAGARALAIEKFGLEVREAEALFALEDRFDVVSMWHVLEHVHRLSDYLNKIHSLLNDKGYLVIAVPNHTSLDARHYKEYWAAYDVPRHLWHFSPESMTKLAQKHGFQIIKKHRMIFDPFYVSLLSESYKNSSMAYPKAFWVATRSTLASLMDINKSSSLVYILKKKNES